MTAYNYFAYLYDELTENAEYQNRCEYICRFLNYNGIDSGLVLDLACGTATLGIMLSEKGYEVIGVDSSVDMLSVAENKSNGKIKLINADMRNFCLVQPADACICSLDSINHLENLVQVSQTFGSVYNSLKKDGLFIFDVNTVYKHKYVLADNAFVFDRENYFLSWDNELVSESTVRIIIDIFVYNGKNYDRYSEEFYETAFETDILKSALEPYFEILGVYDELTLNEPKNDSERLYFVCKRK